MQKNFIFPAIVALALVAIVAIFVVLVKAKNAPPPDSTIIFFYGDTCPHCKNVEEFFTENDVASRISFEQREVYNSTANASLMADKYKKCGITNTNDMGVPLLWDGITCIQGDEPIINYFKSKLGL